VVVDEDPVDSCGLGRDRDRDRVGGVGDERREG
jgi:hypothetical protein